MGHRRRRKVEGTFKRKREHLRVQGKRSKERGVGKEERGKRCEERGVRKEK